MKRRERTCRKTFSPQIAEIIKRTLAVQPDIDLSRLRWILGRHNPGPYGWHRKVWASEATKQVAFLRSLREGTPIPKKQRKGTNPLSPKQTVLF